MAILTMHVNLCIKIFYALSSTHRTHFEQRQAAEIEGQKMILKLLFYAFILCLRFGHIIFGDSFVEHSIWARILIRYLCSACVCARSQRYGTIKISASYIFVDIILLSIRLCMYLFSSSSFFSVCVSCIIRFWLFILQHPIAENSHRYPLVYKVYVGRKPHFY